MSNSEKNAVRIGGGRTCLPGVESLLDCRQQVLRTARGALGVRNEVRLLGCKPPVLQRLMRSRPFARVDRQAVLHEVAGGLGHIRPVFLYKGKSSAYSERN